MISKSNPRSFNPSKACFLVALSFATGAVNGFGQSSFAPTAAGDYNWSDSATWSPATIPNGAGVVIEKSTGVSSNALVQDVSGGRIIGTIQSIGATANTWTINALQGITFNQDGVGSGSAAINLNSNSSGARMVFQGTLTLADNLIVTNSSYTGSSNTGGIDFIGTITGNGNITFANNASNTFGGGHIRVGGANDFVGSVTVAKGAVSISQSTSLGSSANTVTLGSSGGGDASLMSFRPSSGANLTVANNIVVASGSGGTLVLGAGTAINATAVSTTYSGTVSLNGNVTLRNENTAGVSTLTFSNVISGAGDVTIDGTDATFFTAANTYTGDTTLSTGSVLTLGNTSEMRFSLLDGNVTNQILGSGTLTLNGLFRIDATSLTGTSGSWQLINVGTLSETFGGTFGLAFLGGPSFTNAGGGIFNSGDWSFSTTTGYLTLVPEPSSALLLSLGSVLLFRRIRRKS